MNIHRYDLFEFLLQNWFRITLTNFGESEQLDTATHQTFGYQKILKPWGIRTLNLTSGHVCVKIRPCFVGHYLEEVRKAIGLANKKHLDNEQWVRMISTLIHSNQKLAIKQKIRDIFCFRGNSSCVSHLESIRWLLGKIDLSVSFSQAFSYKKYCQIHTALQHSHVMTFSSLPWPLAITITRHEQPPQSRQKSSQVRSKTTLTQQCHWLLMNHLNQVTEQPHPHSSAV